MVESEPPPCFLQSQETGIPSSVTRPSATDFQFSLSAAKSASLYAAASRAASEPLFPFICSLSCLVPARYRTILFAGFRSAIDGQWGFRDAL
ncbi:hypothetical protein PHMEG_00020075 [Phytophthora megakarya]|uniref:Uncharacterized protein n=1 Tax=Phytophthora megakarya TaxID=4795 RepID=A0A225VSM8_9STRA|nr:hypothetical protein PHMEG_00020075 [Phytophthora megakarya]